MAVEVCVKCNGTSLSKGEDGTYVCNSCGYKGQPIVFTSFDAYENYLRLSEGKPRPKAVGEVKNRKPLVYAGVAVIIVILIALLAAILSPSEPKSKTLAVICNPPYIRDGGGCCLDLNSNSLCDKTENRSETSIAAEESTLPIPSTSST